MTALLQDNIALNEREIAARAVRLESKPRLLMLVLTNACNLDCIMCGRARAGRTVTLPLEAARKVAELFPHLEAIDWQGGETFIVPYFKELFTEAARHPGIRHSVITNGLLLDRDWAGLLARSGASLTFSVDAASPATYEKIRRGGDFSRLRQNLRLVRDAAATHHINVVVMRSNHKELELFPDFCAEHGIKGLRFDFLRPDTAPEEDILLKRDEAAAAHLRESLPRIRAACAAAGIGFECTFEGLLRQEPTEPAPESAAPAGCGANSCKLPWKKLCVDACRNGDVFPDCLCRRSAGDIHESGLLELWNGPGMRHYRETLAAGRACELCAPDCLMGTVDSSHFEGRA